MIRKISRARCLAQWNKFPYSFNRGDELFYPDIHESYILTIPSKSARGHARQMAAAVQQLLLSMGIDALICMGDTKTPWQYQQNEYPPVKAALDYLRQHKVGEKYNGALLVTADELPGFLIHLFWLVRCNASLPVIYGMDQGQHLLLNYCQYGNLHLSTLDQSTDQLFQQQLPHCGLHYFEDGYCYESFGRSAKISGRNLQV